MSQGDNKNPDGGMVQGVAVAMAGTVIGGGIVAAMLQPRYTKPILICVLAAIILVVLAILVLRAISAARRKRKAAGLSESVGRIFDKPDADPDVKARLEETKRKFLLLIDRLKKEGHKNIYEMPWFLTLGPSGTGKSWVLKSSGLEPLEEVEWEQGTFLIDWWSCSDALVLDTAGGVVFREDKSYDSPEWKALLELLKKHRPQCPITGVLVIVPAQLLWLNPEELPEGWLTLDEYGNALRNQLRKRLQSVLQVRFPVHVLVTQC